MQYKIEVVPDLPPEISIEEPEEALLRVPPDAPVKVRLRAVDPDFGLTKVGMEVRIQDAGKIQEINLLNNSQSGVYSGGSLLVPRQLGAAPGQVLEYRGVAVDNRPDRPNETRTDWQRLIIDDSAPARQPPSEESMDDSLEKTGDDIIQNTEKLLFDLAERGTFSQSFSQFGKALDQTLEMATNAMKNDQGIVGVPTGLDDLDERLGGLHKSDLVIIAGRPSMGKTALATNIAFNAAKKIQETGDKSSIAFFSLEMSSEQLSTRILAEQSRIKSNDIRRGRISEEQFDKFIETSKNISELPLYIDETPAISIAALSNRARRIKRLYGLDMVVIDYIQLMRASNFREGRVQEISEITQGLKALAKELSVPVLALSQLSRAVEQRDDKKPQLADLRESGSIEQDADVVMFVYREAYYLERKEPRPATVEHAEWQSKMNEVSNLAEIIIGKQRHGPTGNIMLEFEAMFTKFKDIQNN